MSAPTPTEQDRKLYLEARDAAAVCSSEFAESFNLETHEPEICLRDGKTGEVYPIAILKPECSYDDRRLMLRAPVLLRAVILVAERSFAEVRALRAEIDRLKGKPDKDYAAQCAMLCDDRRFRQFLVDRHGLTDLTDRERTVSRVRSVLSIRSRAELNDDQAAAERWKSLVSDYENWKRTGR